MRSEAKFGDSAGNPVILDVPRGQAASIFSASQILIRDW